MTEIVLKSETKVSQLTNGPNIGTGDMSEVGLFNSLFGIITENSEEFLQLENQDLIDEREIVSDNSLIEDQENENVIFSALNEKLFIRDYQKNILNSKNNNFMPNQNLTTKNKNFEINLKIIDTEKTKDFTKTLSEVVEIINNKSLIKNVTTQVIEDKIQDYKLENMNFKKLNKSVTTIDDLQNGIILKKIKVPEFDINQKNTVIKHKKEELLFMNFKKNNSTSIKNLATNFKTVNSLKIQDSIKTDNTYSNSSINISSQNTNTFNQFTNSNFNGSTSFYSGSQSSLEYLNMLDKSWSTNLLNKVEKAIKNGNEKIEISLKPNNLGKLKISLSLSNDSARINIITENSSAALLLSEAESKLSQMFENTGLKLSNFNTSSDQSKKHNTNNSNKDEKEKKMLAKDEASLEKGMKMSSKINSENQILNLLA